MDSVNGRAVREGARLDWSCNELVRAGCIVHGTWLQKRVIGRRRARQRASGQTSLQQQQQHRAIVCFLLCYLILSFAACWLMGVPLATPQKTAHVCPKV